MKEVGGRVKEQRGRVKEKRRRVKEERGPEGGGGEEQIFTVNSYCIVWWIQTQLG